MKEQNNCLNFFKGLACIFVVSLHVRFPVSYIDGPIQALARFAVPFFFMVSGYYCYYEDKEVSLSRMPKKIKHIGILCLGAFIFWFLFIFATKIIGGTWQSIGEWLLEAFCWQSVLRLVLWNVDPFINILWFFFALLYCYIIYYLFIAIKKRNILKILVIPLLIAHFVMGNILGGVFNIGMAADYYRNAWLMGLPLFMIGNMLREYQTKIQEKITRRRALIGIVSGGVLSIGEWLLVGGRQQMWIGSIIAAACMIIYAQQDAKRYVIKPVAVIGQKYSMLVYVLHWAVIILLGKVTDFIGISDVFVYQCFRPTTVILLSVVAAIVVDFIYRRIKFFVANRKKRMS